MPQQLSGVCATMLRITNECSEAFLCWNISIQNGRPHPVCGYRRRCVRRWLLMFWGGVCGVRCIADVCLEIWCCTMCDESCHVYAAVCSLSYLEFMRLSTQVRVVGAVWILQARPRLHQAALRYRHPTAQRDGCAAHWSRAYELHSGAMAVDWEDLKTALLNMGLFINSAVIARKEICGLEQSKVRNCEPGINPNACGSPSICHYIFCPNDYTVNGNPPTAVAMLQII